MGKVKCIVCLLKKVLIIYIKYIMILKAQILNQKLSKENQQWDREWLLLTNKGTNMFFLWSKTNCELNWAYENNWMQCVSFNVPLIMKAGISSILHLQKKWNNCKGHMNTKLGSVRQTLNITRHKVLSIKARSSTSLIYLTL